MNVSAADRDSRPIVHVCMASRHMLVNIIPVLMKEQGTPVTVYLLTTPNMAESAHRAQRIFNAHGLGQTNIHHWSGADYHSLVTDLRVNFLPKLSGECQVVLNVTSGKKSMAFALHQVLSPAVECRVIYVDVERRCIDTIYPENVHSQQFAEVLTADDYLEAYGFEVTSSAAVSANGQWNNCSNFLMERADDGSFISFINDIATRWSEDSAARGIILHDPRYKSRYYRNRKSLERLVGFGIIRYTDKGTQRRLFTNTLEKARYLGGGWLEQLAAKTLIEVGITDVRISVRGRWTIAGEQPEVANEFDVVAEHGNRLCIVECKTGAIQSGIDSVIYKLESLARHIGGTQVEAVLISTRAIGPQSAHRRRAEKLGIRIFDGSDAMTRFAMWASLWKQGY